MGTLSLVCMQGNEQSPSSHPSGLKGRTRRGGTRRLASAAWEPLTPGGVARYSMASLNRVCGLQVVTALASMVVILWFLSTAIFPVVREAITQLPEAGRMALGELESPVPAILPLAENSHLSIHLDLENDHRLPTSHDLDVKLTRKGLYACTSFGCSFVPYGMTWRFPVDRTETLAWWDAWSGMLLAMAGFGTVVGLIVVWWVLATLYCVVPRILACFGNRPLTLGGAWRLSAAALIPGAVTMLAGVVFYGLGTLDWVHFVLMVGIHWVVPWLYLVAAPFQLARREKKEDVGMKRGEDASLGEAGADSRDGSPFVVKPVVGANPFQGDMAPVEPVAEPGTPVDSAVRSGVVESGRSVEEGVEGGMGGEESKVESGVETPPVILPKARGNPFAAPRVEGDAGGRRAGGGRRKSNPFRAE